MFCKHNIAWPTAHQPESYKHRTSGDNSAKADKFPYLPCEEFVDGRSHPAVEILLGMCTMITSVYPVFMNTSP